MTEKRSIEGRSARFKTWFLTQPAHIQIGVALGTLIVVGTLGAILFVLIG